MVDDMGEGIGGQGLGGTIGTGGWTSGCVGEQKADRGDRWGWAARNSSVVEMLSLSVNKESSFQARVPADHC